MEGGVTVEQAAVEPRTRLPYLPALDGLRAVALIAVVFFHQALVSPLNLKGGFLGVDVFFVLSGFLITSLLVAEHGRDGRIALRAFWGRRARRLLPAVFLTILLVSAYALVAARPVELPHIRSDAIATLFYVANWHRVFGSQFRTPLNHTWSLSVEEQWYLIWPVVLGVLLVLTRKNARARVPLLLGGACVSALWTYVLLGTPGSFPHRDYGTDTRAQALLVGAALALWLRRDATHDNATRWKYEGAGIAGACVLAYFMLTSDLSRSALYQGGLLVVALAAAAVIAAAVQPASPILGPVLSWRPLRAIGLVSYGAYLYHLPIMAWLTPARTHMHGIELLAVQLVLTAVLSVLSFVLVEKPVRRSDAPPAQLATLAFGALAVTLLAVYVGTSHTRVL